MASPATRIHPSSVRHFRVRRLGHIPRHIHRRSAALRAPQRHMTILVLPQQSHPALWCALDGLVPAGWARQALPVTIGQDELQRFRRTVLLDAATSHLLYASALGAANV